MICPEWSWTLKMYFGLPVYNARATFRIVGFYLPSGK
jgi:hypothetical protein